MFPGGGDIIYLAEYWLESNLSLLRFYQQQGSSRITIVHHQKVLTQPGLVAKQLSNILGLEGGELTKISQSVKPDEVGLWKSLLTIEEENKLREFREQYTEDIAVINALATS